MTGPQPTAETEIPEPPRPKRRWVPFAVLGVLALAGVIWGIRTFLYSRSHETTDNAQIEGHVVPVLPKVGGYVARVLVEDNQVVREGDTLVTLDPRDYEVRLQEAQADLRAAEAAAARNGEATAQVGQASARSGAARASIGSAQATYDRALRDVQRMRTLSETRVISKQQLDEAEATYRSAEADLRAAQSQARAAQAEVSGASAGVRTAQAHLAAAQASTAAAELQLSYTVITAPASGRVSKKTVEVGQLVSPGQSLMSLVDEGDVWVVANLKETQLDDIAVGQPVEIEVDAYKGRTFSGRVESIQGATGARFALLPPDNATGNFTKVVQRVPVRIALDRRPANSPPLRPGMSVEVAIDTRAEVGAVTTANDGARGGE
ncbi:MAG TPA: HlyD family secretion protein [Gemmatimonadales bacterium]|nr:HlyD family secretion protein [Gemmatimonadales bacterium]